MKLTNPKVNVVIKEAHFLTPPSLLELFSLILSGSRCDSAHQGGPELLVFPFATIIMSSQIWGFFPSASGPCFGEVCVLMKSSLRTFQKGAGPDGPIGSRTCPWTVFQSSGGRVMSLLLVPMETSSRPGPQCCSVPSEPGWAWTQHPLRPR